MHTKETLIRDLSQLAIDPAGTLMVHSSFKAIGVVEGGADTVLDAFIEYMRQGLLVFPTHTWHETNNKNDVYDPLHEPSCVGALTNLFLRRAGVIRSLHPTHSVAALGKDAYQLVSGEENSETPCPSTGTYGKLYQRKAQIMFLGCSLKSNTIIHGVEEWRGIPNRLAAQPTVYTILLPGGESLKRPVYRHGWPGGDISQHYAKLLQPLLYKQIATTGKVGAADAILCDAREMCDLASRFLTMDPEVFSNDGQIPTSWYVD